MSISSGGRADKLGNRYEGLWVAYQLLMLLAERVVAVEVEAIGEDECGVDVWVTRPDGTRDAQQCKRKNRSAGGWTVGDLDSRGVLEHSARQLDRNPTALFTLVSADPAAELRELCDAARASGGDAEAYFQSMLKVTAHVNRLESVCVAAAVVAFDR